MYINIKKIPIIRVFLVQQLGRITFRRETDTWWFACGGKTSSTLSTLVFSAATALSNAMLSANTHTHKHTWHLIHRYQRFECCPMINKVFDFPTVSVAPASLVTAWPSNLVMFIFIYLQHNKRLCMATIHSLSQAKAFNKPTVSAFG